MNVLIVDDEYYVVQGVLGSLTASSMELDEVFGAYSVAQAEEIFRQHPVSILITDIEMPRETGFDLLYWIKEKGYSPITVLLTGHKKFEYAHEAVQLNCFQYLVKPVAEAELLAVMAEAIQKAQIDTAFQEWQAHLSDEQQRQLLRTDEPRDLVGKVERIVAERIACRELTRNSIAKEVFLNADYLSYKFHKEAGMTLNSYILMERIARVKRLLDETEKSLEQIAQETGFTDALYLRKVFKQHEGLTPNQYRKGIAP